MTSPRIIIYFPRHLSRDSERLPPSLRETAARAQRRARSARPLARRAAYRQGTRRGDVHRRASHAGTPGRPQQVDVGRRVSPRALRPFPAPAVDVPVTPTPSIVCRLAHRAPPIPRPARRSASVRNGTDTSSSFYDDDDDDTTDEIYRYGVGPAGDVSVRARLAPPAFRLIFPFEAKRSLGCPLPRGRPPTRAARVAHLPPPTSTDAG